MLNKSFSNSLLKQGDGSGKRFKSGKLIVNKREIFFFREMELSLTQKQLEVLKLIAQGHSNAKVAKIMQSKESAIKISIYRIMKYLEHKLNSKIDRFYLVVLAQKILIENFYS